MNICVDGMCVVLSNVSSVAKRVDEVCANWPNVSIKCEHCCKLCR